MDYRTKPLSRPAIRQISKSVRRMFGLNQAEPFPVLQILDKICILFDGTDYLVVEDEKLPAEVFAWCYPKPEGGYRIEIKQTVYDGACYDGNRACHREVPRPKTVMSQQLNTK